MEQLDKLTSNPKIEGGQYGELMAVLKKAGYPPVFIIRVYFMLFEGNHALSVLYDTNINKVKTISC